MATNAARNLTAVEPSPNPKAPAIAARRRALVDRDQAQAELERLSKARTEAEADLDRATKAATAEADRLEQEARQGSAERMAARLAGSPIAPPKAAPTPHADALRAAERALEAECTAFAACEAELQAAIKAADQAAEQALGEFVEACRQSEFGKLADLCAADLLEQAVRTAAVKAHGRVRRGRNTIFDTRPADPHGDRIGLSLETDRRGDLETVVLRIPVAGRPDLAAMWAAMLAELDAGDVPTSNEPAPEAA